MTKNRLTAISLFSGAGGMDAGFEMAGFDVRLALEIDPSCCDTLRRNLPNTRVLNASVYDLHAEEMCELAGLKIGEVDCVIGGPPCQSFSLAGNRAGLDDDRGKLVFRFVELVRQTMPRVFVMENVKGMVNWQGGIVMNEIENRLKTPLTNGDTYQVSSKVLNSADFGVAQFRERVFVVGHRIDGDYRFPSATHAPYETVPAKSRLSYVTVNDAIGSLPPADAPSETAQRVSKTIKGRIARHGY